MLLSRKLPPPYPVRWYRGSTAFTPSKLLLPKRRPARIRWGFKLILKLHPPLAKPLNKLANETIRHSYFSHRALKGPTYTLKERSQTFPPQSRGRHLPQRLPRPLSSKLPLKLLWTRWPYQSFFSKKLFWLFRYSLEKLHSSSITNHLFFRK